MKLRYDWEVPDTPSVCLRGDIFHVDHAMIYKRSGFVIQRHKELRNLEAELLEVEPVLQDITREELNRRANTEKSVKQTDTSITSEPSITSTWALMFFFLRPFKNVLFAQGIYYISHD